MDLDNISGRAGKNGALPSVAQNVHILLVDHDTTSLMSLTSEFEQQFYKVTTTESATIALSLFSARKDYYDIVIADRSMPDMDIYEFVHKVQCHRMNTPIILIAENFTMDWAMKTLGNEVCYIFPKPPSHRDIAILWQHIFRVTGNMPPSTVSNYIDIEKYGNPSGSSSDDAARNQKQSNLRMNIINTDRENMNRGKNQIAEDSNSSNDTDEDDGHNSKKSRMTWTSSLHQKFLKAINILGEHGAQPRALLSTMNEPGLTHRQVSSHLQKYRNRKRLSVNLQTTASAVMPTVLPATPMSFCVQGQTSGSTNLNYMAARGAPNFVGYSLDAVKEKLDALNYPGNNTPNAIIANGSGQIPQGSGGVQIGQVIYQNHNTNENRSANIGEQAQVFPQRFGHGTMECYHLSNGWKAPNHEPAGATLDVIPSTGLLSNSLQAINQEPAGETSDVILAGGHLSNGLQAPNQDSAGDFGVGMYGVGNVGNPANVNNDSFGEDTSANLQLDGMPSNDDVSQIMPEFEASGTNVWDFIN